MALNKYMHPRNIYKTPPNFKQMAIDYPDFRKHVKQDITGKIRIDFKNNETLRALSRTLLKKDFGLDVLIPLDRLIPTVPLRLNYILWIEDLLSIIPDEDSFEKEDIHGIDIGTGASCIYSLLTAKIYSWYMTATEINAESYSLAQANVERNGLQHLVQVHHTVGDELIKHVLDAGKIYNFCMCNPPFFAATADLDPEKKSRTPRRALPRNAPSGETGEVVVSGGEVAFITRLIMESVELKAQVKIFTTMVGHKCNLATLKALLRQAEVASFKQTEFHQGHTTRWGLAWTYYDIDLRKVPQATVAAARRRSKVPLKFVIPPTPGSSLTPEQVINKVRDMLQSLRMNYEPIKRGHYMYALQVTAKENTWSHARRKRREHERKQQLLAELQQQQQGTSHGGLEEAAMELDTVPEGVVLRKRPRNDDDDEDSGYYNNNVKKLKVAYAEELCLKMILVIRRVAYEYHVEMSHDEESSCQDNVHQVMQYFKNNWTKV